MRDFQFMALTPAGSGEPSIAIAASRAGELGVLNLEHVHNVPAARKAIADLIHYTDKPNGVRFDSGAFSFIEEMTPRLPGQVRVVILTCSDADGLGKVVPICREHGLTILAEVTNTAQVAAAEALGVDGLIAKGHEAGGWVGDETTFTLLQRLLARSRLPVWAFGGIGLHTAAACYAAGAAGVVLDSQLALTRESPLPEPVRAAIAAMDGSETTCLGTELGLPFRTYMRPGSAAVQALNERAIALIQDGRPHDEVPRAWRQAVEASVGWGSPQENIWPLGQDAAFASSLADRFHTVGGILSAMRDAPEAHVQSAASLRSLGEHSPLAQAIGCRYPIVQGPMTRVSDSAEFALRVAEGGGLPFLALALMRASDVEALLAETKVLLGDRPWGVGILGFVPLELRQEQLEVVRRFRPPYALIAGGRPDQARVLEDDGIATYLHVPSPGLLRLFLQAGARRFVFEGRECGGHVGPRSSFVLWDSMVDVLLEELPPGEAKACHVLFAGGIHDRLSAAMVATTAAPLADRGVRVGVLMGTAYLFTEEAVTSGAILSGFQEQALRCAETVLLESGPGHATRCVPTPFVQTFNQEKLRLLKEGNSSQEVRYALELLNVGRLRLASKGITRRSDAERDPNGPRYTAVDAERQYQDGLYMIGQVAALHDRTCTIGDLHGDVATGSARLLEDFVAVQPASVPRPEAQPSAIAIVGMSALLPKARNLQDFWGNILNRTSAITEVPKERWDPALYYDPDRDAPDKTYSKWGGFLDDVSFDPLEFGIPPNSLRSIDPMHLLSLLAARDALADAGYARRPFDRSRTSVILGASGGTGDLGAKYLLRSGLPLLFGQAGFELASEAGDFLPSWTEDSFAGLLLNVAAGRIANRFDLGGLNYVVDAACASSLAAVHLAVKELETHNTDMVIVGGVDTAQNPFGYLCFSKTQALSARGEPRVFDATADGIVISEGVVMLVLKRLADAERDGDRIYAVIQAVGGSSDGRGMGLTAPRPEGQMLALKRAYAKAGFSPTTVDLFEAHGTGTVVGDRTEATALARFLKEQGARPQAHAIGSVKSMIGHTKATAGVAGVAKVACALYHKVLPPTLGVTQPNPKAGFGDGPLYVNSETRPWVHDSAQHPRRAGVSAFGFGGSNFHAVLEEYTGDFLAAGRKATMVAWPSELLLWRAGSRADLLSEIETLRDAIDHGARPALHDLAYSLWLEASARFTSEDLCLTIVSDSLDDLARKLLDVSEQLKADGLLRVQDARGIYLSEERLATKGEVAFLFPGQGSQYPNMLRDLAIHFPEVREIFEQVDRVLQGKFEKALSSYVYPPPAFTTEEERAQRAALTQTNVAQPSVGAADAAAARLLQALGVEPALVAGHSYGEYAALCAAGVIDLDTLAVLSEARGRSIIEAASDDLGTMAAVRAPAATIVPILETVADVWVANLNAPNQTIISGTKAGVAAAVLRLAAHDIAARSIPVACAFHSPLMAPAQERLAKVLSQAVFAAPRTEVFSNTIAAPYPHEPQAIRELLADHLVRPVRFSDEVEAMYAAGARLFVEAGPGNVLTGLVGQVLGGRPHLAMAMDLPRRNGLTQLQHALAQLAAHGIAVQLERLFEGRAARRLNLQALEEETTPEPLSSNVWLVNGSRARPVGAAQDAPHPLLLDSLAARRTGENRASAGAAPRATSAAGARPLASPAPGSAPTPQAEPGREVSGAVVPSDDQAGQVLLMFQESMSHFLETQQKVMLSYLQGTGTPVQEEPMPSLGKDEHVTHAFSPTSSSTGPGEAEALPHRPPAPAVEAASPVPETVEVSHPAGKGRGVGEPLPDKEQLTHQLLRIVSERTGYPPEMLDLDVDIEAQLGIDSIKRVEILGIIQRDAIPPDRQIPQPVVERLTSVKTLRGIVDAIDETFRASTNGHAPMMGSESLESPASHGREEAVAQDGPVVAEDSVPRFVLATVDAPALPDRALHFAPDRPLLITSDGQGIADTLAQQIRMQGGRGILVELGSGIGVIDGEAIQADLTDPAIASELVARLRERYGTLGGIIHLLPLRDRTELAAMDLAAWRDRIRRDVKSLFYLARAAAGDLKQPGSGRSHLMAATTMGGSFAWDGAERPGFFPGQGGVAGLVKTLAIEWPEVHCQVIDLDLKNPATSLAAQLLRELGAQDGLVEAGYTGAQRRRLRLVPADLDEDRPVSLAIEHDWVLLVTGGARGITAEVACELAERYRPTLVIAARSPAPDPQESPQTAGLTTPRELKAALMDQMRQARHEVTLAQVEAVHQRLIKEREIRENLARLRLAGANVSYSQVDVRDEQAMAHLIDQIYRQHGRLDGVIHGAGIIEDKLVEDKTPDSFDRVFDTKADSAFILSRVLRPERLKFLALFSSAAGPFGNRGQSDYAATNETVNKLALYLDRRWPGRVVSINWGPWLKTGMVSSELQREFARRNVQLISIPAGCRALDRELRHGRKGEAVVVIAGGAWGGGEAGIQLPTANLQRPSSGQRAGVPITLSVASSELPLLQHATSSRGTDGRVEAVLRLDPSEHLYLRDHQLDGKPVLPMAMAMELMAEVAQGGWPDLQVAGLRDLQVLRGVVVENGARDIRVVTRAQVEPPHERLGIDVHAEIVDPHEPGRPYYRATVELADRLPSPPPYQGSRHNDLQPFPLTVEEAYRRWLFHGPLFRGIAEIHGISEREIAAVLLPSSPQRCLSDTPTGQWLIDPMVFDSGLQMFILWTRASLDMTPLPSRLQRYRRFAPLSSPKIQCYVNVLDSSRDHIFHIDIAFVGPDGSLLGLLEDMEGAGNPALNRLTGTHAHP